MSGFSSITSLKAAEDASREGYLVKALLFPAELGGQDRPEASYDKGAPTGPFYEGAN
jgi:hypothetical protein